MTLITQRSAAINKSVLTQVGTLIAMRTTGPQDRAAIEAWLQYHSQSREILASLPGLPDGDAWVWSPRFLGTTKRVHFHLRETYDSGATPKAQAQTRAAATLADVDLDAVKGAMAATIQRAKQEDPRELRRQLAEVRRELEQARKAMPAAKPGKPVEIPVLKAAEIKRLEAVAERVDRAMVELGKWAQAFTGTEREVRNAAGAICEALVRLRAGPVQATAHLRPGASHATVRAVAEMARAAARRGRAGRGARRLDAHGDRRQDPVLYGRNSSSRSRRPGSARTPPRWSGCRYEGKG